MFTGLWRCRYWVKIDFAFYFILSFNPSIPIIFLYNNLMVDFIELYKVQSFISRFTEKKMQESEVDENLRLNEP